MKLLNTLAITTLLSVGLAANALAAPNNYEQRNGKNGAQKVLILKQAQKKASKKVAVKRTQQRVVKRVIKQAPKKVVKRIVKHTPKKAVVKHYRVRPGDTLSRIAAKSRTSVNQLIKMNKLWGNKANNLKIGMVLRIA